jgi:hypothetical protein
MAQVEQTTNEVAARGALFGEQVGFHGIPWRMLASHEHWLVGDGYSGQFRLAAAVLRPKRITFLDDGRAPLRPATGRPRRASRTSHHTARTRPRAAARGAWRRGALHGLSARR